MFPHPLSGKLMSNVLAVYRHYGSMVVSMQMVEGKKKGRRNKEKKKETGNRDQRDKQWQT